jgi:hypothetical protein
MLLKTSLMFPNSKDDLPQLLLKDVKGQFTLWEGANMRKPFPNNVWHVV